MAGFDELVVSFWFAVAGIVFGVVFDAGKFLKIATKENRLVVCVLDFFCVIFGFVAFVLVAFKTNFGIIQIYEIAFFLLGFVILHFSLFKLVANIFSFVYNTITKILKSLKKNKLFKFLMR